MREAFETYLQSATENVGSKRQKKEIQWELYDHLQELYERNLATGLDEAAAEKQALAEMGDSESLNLQFGALYPVQPNLYMSTSLNLIGVGIFLSLMRLDFFFAGFGVLTQMVGYVLLTLGLLRLSSLHRCLRAASYLYLFERVLWLVTGFLFRYSVEGEGLYQSAMILDFAEPILQCIVIILLFVGLNKVLLQSCAKPLKKPRLLFTGILFFLFYMALIAVSVNRFCGETQNVSVPFPFDLLFYLPFLFLIVSFSRIKKIVRQEETDLEIPKPMGKIGKTVFACAATAVLLLNFALMPVAAFRKPEMKPYIQADTEAQSVEVEAARAQMLSLGFPEKLLADLPDSEVLHFQKATKMRLCDCGTTAENVDVQAFCFRFTQEEQTKIRVLYVFQHLENQPCPRSGFCMNFSPEDTMAFRYFKSEDAPKFSAFVLAQVDDETVRCTPLCTRLRQDNTDFLEAEITYPRGAVNCRAYFSAEASLIQKDNTPWDYVNAQYTFQKFPLALQNTSAMSYATQSTNMFAPTDPFFTRRDVDVNFDWASEEK